MSKVLLFLTLVSVSLCEVTLGDNVYNHTLWNQVVHDHVAKNRYIDGIDTNAVDYPTIRRTSEFKNYISLLSKWHMSTIVTKQDEIALYINTYNAYAVKVIADNPCKIRFGKFCYPAQSIWDVGTFYQSVWNMHLVTLSGKLYSLDDIENHLRNMTIPHIHACLVCASVSCPDLMTVAYTPENVIEAMEIQMRRFLSNPTKGLLYDPMTKVLHLSKIFLWYEKDFVDYVIVNNLGNSVLDYVVLYAPAHIRNDLETYKDQIKIDYLSYNWGINDILTSSKSLVHP